MPIPTDGRYLYWARAMDAGLKVKPVSLKPAIRPAPKPPVAVRPNQMSVTEVEVFVRDPYAIYAKRILNLRPMERPNEPVEARQRGTAIHKSLERFVAEDVPLGAEGARRLTLMLEQELAATHLSPAQMGLQRPLLADMAREFVAFEGVRRADKPRLVIEERGELTLNTAHGDFTLIAKADRIEVREDTVDVLDFKTGLPPSVKQVVAGFYPQLTLTAAMIRMGAFAGITTQDKALGDLVYVRVGTDATVEKIIRDKSGQTTDDLADAAILSLKRRIEDYGKAHKPYLSWTAPQFLKVRGGDYDQLARLYEWNVLGDEETPDEEASS